MIKAHLFNRKTDLICLIGVLFLPFRPAFSVALFIVTVIADKIIRKERPFLHFEPDTTAMAMMAFYLMHVLGMFYTENIPFGSLDLQIKATFILLPLIYMSIGPLSIDKSFVAGFWILSSLFVGMVCLLKALPLYITDPQIAHITYSEFCFFSHPTYLSLYLSIGLFLLLEADSIGAFPIKRAIKLTFVFLLFLFILLSQSRTGIAVTFLLLGLNFFKWMRPGNRILLLSFIPVVLALGLYSYLSISSGSDRMNSLVQEVTSDGSGIKDTSKYSATDTRFRIWKSAAASSAENFPFGTGTGDAKSVLMSEYRANGFQDLLEKSYNAHNQYLQSSLALGIPGLILLSLMLLFPLIRFVKSDQLFGVQVVLAFALNCLTECLFEVQAGVIMFAAFLFLFLNNERMKTV